VNEKTTPFRVLVVDDDASIRATYRHILQPPPSELGGLEALISGAADKAETETLFQVIEADQGEKAARLQRSLLDAGERVQLAFIDMRMPPGWDGMRTAVALRAQDPSIYIVIATAYSDYDVNELQRALGHDVVLLRKPFNQEEVFQLARTLCQSWDARQRLEMVTAEMESRVQMRTAELDLRNALQAALVEIITRFIEASGEDDIDDALNWSLARLGRAIDVDGCSYYRFDAALDCYLYSHEWHVLGVKSIPLSLHRIPRVDISPAHTRFLRGESFQFSRLETLPAEMATLASKLEGHYQSILAIPLQIESRLVGFLAIGMAQASAKLRPELEKLLSIIGHAMTSALAANANSRKLRESQAMLARTESLTHTGSWGWNVATGAVLWSSEMFAIMGLPQTALAPSLEEQSRLYDPDDMARLRAAVDTAVNTGQSYELPMRVLRRDGATRTCVVCGHAEIGADGVVTRLFGTLQDLTELQSAKDALQASDARFRNIVETADEGIWQVDADWKTTYVNSRMEDLLGCAPGSMLGRPLGDFVDQAAREQAATLQTRRQLGIREVHDFHFVRADGGDLYALVSTTPSFADDGRFIGSTAMVTDISWRVQQEKALIATAEFVSASDGKNFSADLVRHAAQTLGLDYVHIARLMPSGRSVETEAAWLDGALIANWSYDLSCTPCAEVLRQSRRCIESDVQVLYPEDADLGNLGAQGYVGEPIVSSAGKVLGLLVGATRAALQHSEMVQANLRILAARAAAEWTQREAMLALREERDVTHNILQTAEVIILALDPDGKIRMINRKGCELLGYSEAELLGKDWFSTCLPSSTEMGTVREIFRKALENDLIGSEYYENPVLTRSGELRLIAWHNSSIRDIDGKVIAAMSAGMDVTERRLAENRLHASEERFKRLFEDADALSIQGYLADGTVMYWNQASEKLYGYSPADALGGNLFDLIIPEAMHEGVRAGIRHMFETGQRIEAGRLQLKHKSGRLVPVYSSHTLVKTEGEPTIMFCMDIDLHQLDQAEEALKIALTKYKTLFECFPMGISVSDQDGRILETNAAAASLLGIDPQTHRQRRIDGEEWRIVRRDGTPMPPEEYASVRALTEKQRVENVEMGVVKSDGAITWISATADLLPVAGYGVVVSYGDITAHLEAEEQIRKLAYFDPLTGLPNRRLLMDRLGHAMVASQRSGAYGAVLMLDLDYFKIVNDTCGHDVGDQLLIEVARRLLENIRQVDTVARLGGDEYVVVLDDLESDFELASAQAARVAEKIRLALAAPYQLNGDGSASQSSASIGLTLFQGCEKSPEALLKQADVALYQAKAEGRNRVRT